METVGFLTFETDTAVRTSHEQYRPIARELVREVSLSLGLAGDAYRDAVTDEVIQTAHDAYFASLFQVMIGDSAAFVEWKERNAPNYDVTLEGSEHVDRRAWHPAPFANSVAAVTFNEQADAAVSTVRRQAYGRLYRDILYEHSA